MTRLNVLPVVVVGLLSSACGQEFEPPDRGERVQRAELRYSAALFDSVEWSAEDARISEGNAVYAEECRRCHGTLGRGETDYARERNLSVPSLVREDWPMDTLDALRRRVFTGHEPGMPIFGDGRLDPRGIDAVAAYILLVLRPEMLRRDR